MTKAEFDQKVREAAVEIVGPVIRSWQIEFAGKPDIFIGKLLGEMLTQQVGLRILMLEAMELSGVFSAAESEKPDVIN